MSISITHTPGDTLREELEDLDSALVQAYNMTVRLNKLSTQCARTEHLRVIGVRVIDAHLMLETLERILEAQL